MFLLLPRLRLVVVVLERAKVEGLAWAMTALSKKPRDERVLVAVGSALKAVTANKRMAGTVEARVDLVLIKVLAEAAEVSVEITTIQVLHVVSVVEAVGDLAKAAALVGAAAALRVKLKMTRSKMALEVEGLGQNVVVASEVAVDLVVVVVAAVAVVGSVAAVVVAAALGRVVVVALEVVVVVFQVVMMGKMVVDEVVALAVVVVVVDVGSVAKMVTLQKNVLKRRVEVVVEVEELVMVVVKRDT